MNRAAWLATGRGRRRAGWPGAARTGTAGADRGARPGTGRRSRRGAASACRWAPPDADARASGAGSGWCCCRGDRAWRWQCRPRPTAPGSETGWDVHEAVVVSIGTPSGGLQRATVELRPPEPARTRLRVAAALPGGRDRRRRPLRAAGSSPRPTEGGFGEFLARGGIALDDARPVAGARRRRRIAARRARGHPSSGGRDDHDARCPSRRPAWRRR